MMLVRILEQERSVWVDKSNGKSAVVTGASSGIGEATAEALAAEGASVVVAARREDRLVAPAGRVNGSVCKAVPVACDVTDEQRAHALLKSGRDQFGRAYTEFAGSVVGVDNESNRDLSESVKGW